MTGYILLISRLRWPHGEINTTLPVYRARFRIVFRLRLFVIVFGKLQSRFNTFHTFLQQWPTPWRIVFITNGEQVKNVSFFFIPTVLHRCVSFYIFCCFARTNHQRSRSNRKNDRETFFRYVLPHWEFIIS